MDGTELVTLAGSVGGCMASFLLGLRVCGPRLQRARHGVLSQLVPCWVCELGCCWALIPGCHAFW